VSHDRGVNEDHTKTVIYRLLLGKAPFPHMRLDLQIGVVMSTVVAFSGAYRYHPISPIINPFPAEFTI
jgi:hypothetical protein